MAISNHERVGKALTLLNAGLKPFVERELRAIHGDKWQDVARPRHGRPPSERVKKGEGANLDVAALLGIMWDQWHEVFSKTLGQSERTLVSELRDMRNKWAHQEPISTDDAYRTLDSVVRLLTAVSAPEAAEVESQKQEVLRVRFEEQRKKETKRFSAVPLEGKPVGGLLPWREIVTPHPDVASGKFQQAEFAADLWQVYLGEGSDEYKNPTEFFRRTYLTEGLRRLLTGALQRIGGRGGDPVIELQTNFGGGKTHSMLALYHLFSGTPPGDLPGLDVVFKESGVDKAPAIHRAVLVGTRISPGQPQKKPDGTTVRTLWGELAWQLGGKEGYAIVKKSDETSTNPGDALRELFKKYSPCLVLIDEWVAYARQLLHDHTLPAGTFETQFTFAQALSEAAKSGKTLLVVSIPQSEPMKDHTGRTLPPSDIEIGGEGGKRAVAALKNAIGRVEASWRPASADEGFEIVRRRLFQPITDPKLFVERDKVIAGFMDMYHTQSQEFPLGCREADYERRLTAAYPIHAELFDRLYNDWSTLDRFQRTRGVLRLMASVIHALWSGDDKSLLIMPSTVPIHEQTVHFELTRYLEDNWPPVLAKDVDGPHSLPLQVDGENPNLGRYSACRRVARTIYMGSAPTLRAANRGIEDRQIKLGCVQPGEAVATFGDAIRRLTDRSTYLYVDQRRYWYSTQPSVTRLAEDRATQVHEDEAHEEIRAQLKKATEAKGDFYRIHCCPTTSGDGVGDDREARLVVLGPEHPHVAKSGDSAARKEAAAILESKGTTPRKYRNALVFLAADKTKLSELESAVKSYLAWKSIDRDQETLNLDPFQKKQVETKLKTALETVQARIPEAYQWLLTPVQADPKAPMEWQEIRLQGQDALAVRAGKKLKNDGLLVAQLGATSLRHEMDRVPLWRGEHVPLKQLCDDFAQYLYLPRLRNPEILATAVRDGVSHVLWNSEAFGIADAWDANAKRYRGLKGGTLSAITADADVLVVKPDVAWKQIQAATPATMTPSSGTPLPAKMTGGSPTGAPPAPKVLRRFYGTVSLDPNRLGRDAGKIAEEVVQHLAGLVNAKLDITLEIQAEVPEGVPDKVVRDVTENCRTLKFKSQSFEEQ